MPCPEQGSRHEAAGIFRSCRRSGGRWPLAARAQQSGRVARVAFWMGGSSPNDPEGQRSQPRSGTPCAGSAGSRVATCGSKCAGPPANDGCARRRRRTRRAQPGRNRDDRRADFGGAASPDQDHPDRVHDGHRPGQRRLCRKPCAPGREHHRLHHLRALLRRQMAGDAQGGGAEHDARGGDAESGSSGLERLPCAPSGRLHRAWASK